MSIDQARTHDGRFGTMPNSEPTTTLPRYGDVEVCDSPLAAGVSEDDRDLYTHEHCERFAWAMHEATGWPYAAVIDGQDESSGVYGYIHVGAMRPDGNFLDVEGPRDSDSVLEQYGDASEHEDGESWLVILDNIGRLGIKPDRDIPQEARDRARDVAAAVLAADQPASSMFGSS